MPGRTAYRTRRQFRALADISFYFDTTREALTARHRHDGDPAEWYRRSLYVDWPIHERHKRDVIEFADYYADATREEPRVVSRAGLEGLLAGAAAQPFRCKPYFQPGVWGGQRIKEAAGLPESMPNSAWDFELVAPENSILLGFEGDAEHIDVPFHLLMWAQAGAILGRQGGRDFGEFFPVRVNYLDTIGDSDLSTQVHPQDLYIGGRPRLQPGAGDHSGHRLRFGLRHRPRHRSVRGRALPPAVQGFHRR